MRGTLKWGMMTLQLSPNSVNPAIHRQFMANLWQGLRLALLRTPHVHASLGQLLCLLALGWACALLVDGAEMTGMATLAPWGVVAEAARSYFWLATLGLITLLPGLRCAFLPLAVSLAAADILIWLAWYLLGFVLPRLSADTAETLQTQLWWLFLLWQVAIFAVALRGASVSRTPAPAVSFSSEGGTVPAMAPRARRPLAQILAVALYAVSLQVNLNLLPDYPLWEDSPQAVPRLMWKPSITGNLPSRLHPSPRWHPACRVGVNSSWCLLRAMADRMYSSAKQSRPRAFLASGTRQKLAPSHSSTTRRRSTPILWPVAPISRGC